MKLQYFLQKKKNGKNLTLYIIFFLFSFNMVSYWNLTSVPGENKCNEESLCDTLLEI